MSDLEELLVSGAELDRQLAGVLKPVLRIDKDSLRMRPAERWNGLSARAKILAFLLGRKAMIALGLSIPQEAVAPLQIIAETGIPRGTVAPKLKALYESRPQLVDRDGEARYWVPDWAVNNACAVIRAELAREG